MQSFLMNKNGRNSSDTVSISETWQESKITCQLSFLFENTFIYIYKKYVNQSVRKPLLFTRQPNLQQKFFGTILTWWHCKAGLHSPLYQTGSGFFCTTKICYAREEQLGVCCTFTLVLRYTHTVLWDVMMHRFTIPHPFLGQLLKVFSLLPKNWTKFKPLSGS